MAKKTIKILAVILCMMSVGPHYWQASGQNYYESAAHNVIWPKKLQHEVSFLCDSICHGRATGTRGNIEAGFWIVSEFARYGLLPLGHNYDNCPATSYARHCDLGGGKIGHNMVAMLPGSIKSPKDKYIIVGAHYDAIGEIGGKLYPGADSNASGTVALISLAQMFGTMKTLGKCWDSNILFVAFDAKELGMRGSASLWRDIENGRLIDPLTDKTITPSQISLMVNIDQVGAVSDPVHKGREDYLIMLGNDSLDRQYKGLADYCNNLYGTKLDLNYSYYGSERFSKIFYRISDQRVFVEHGIPAVFFTSGITMKTNKTTDTPETLNYDVLRKRIIFIYHWIDKMLSAL